MTTSFADHLEARFGKEGYVRLGRLLSDDELSALCRRSDDLMLGNVVIDGIVFQLDPESRRYGNLPGEPPVPPSPPSATGASTSSTSIRCSSPTCSTPSSAT